MPLNRRVKVGIEIGLLIGTAIVIALGVSIGFTAYLGNPKHPHVAVTTGSMIPIYNGFFEEYDDGDIIPFQGVILIVRNTPTSSIQVGDVIIFNTTEITDDIVHRVVAIWEENGTYYFKTKGDNNDQPDNWNDGITTGDNIHGVVVFRVPHIGWFLLVIQTPLGRILLIALAFLVLFIGDEEEEDEEEEEEKSETNLVNQNKGESSYEQKKLDEDEKTQELGMKNTNMTPQLYYLKFSGFARDISTKIIHSKKYFYSSFALLIIIFFLTSNLFCGLTSSPSIKLFPLNDDLKTQNLLLSTNSSLQTLDITQNKNLPSYYWFQEDNTSETYLFPIQIEIRSGGIFNNINRIEIISRVNGTEGFYQWDIVYNFIGTRTFKGGIIAFLNPVNGVYFADISLTLYSRGLLASTPKVFEFPLMLDSS